MNNNLSINMTPSPFGGFRGLLLGLAAAALFVSCTREKDLHKSDTPQQAVQFAATLPTRTTNGGDRWVVGDSVGIYMLTAGGTIAANTIADNVPYTVTNATTGALTSAAPILFPSAGNVDFVAYYPYSTAVSADGKYTVSLTNQSDPAAIDVLRAKVTNRSNNGTPVPLSFAHTLSKITLNLKAGMYVRAADVAATTNVILSQTPASAVIDLNDGSLTPRAVADITLYKEPTATAGYDATFTAIVVPQAGTTGRQLSAVIAGENYTWNIPATDAFTAGKHYSYEVVRRKEESIAGLNYRITWDAANNWYVLTNNPTDAGLHFKFGSVVGVYTGNGAVQTLPAVANGDPFDVGDMAWTPTAAISAWGNVPVYASSDYPKNITPEDLYHTIANVKAGKGDPCRLVGLDLNRIKNTPESLLTNADIDNGVWRLPTAAENQSFSGQTANVTFYAHWTTLNGAPGGMFPTAATGSAATFLPVAGYREHGTVTNQHLNANYWSSAPTNAFIGYNLHFTFEKLYPLNYYDSTYGFNVRCVRQ